MRKVSSELPIGYQKKKKKKKNDIKNTYNIKWASKNKINRYKVNLIISWKK